ncbi:MAG: hypothetical protein R8M70_00935 [Alphaproteobacteria bacterium]|nr:hypothetical protein [Alphaproteobacteria bacterium]
MRFLLTIFCAVVISGNVLAQELLTRCPDGYITISEPGVVLYEKECPSSNTIMLSNDIPSCSVETPSALCAMYAESGEPYTDKMGLFYYDGVCEM